VKIPNGSAAVTDDKGPKKATAQTQVRLNQPNLMLGGKAGPEDDSEVRRPAHSCS
jgi:hypothetical protein